MIRTCAGCGIDFIPATKGGRARFHSEACRKAASRRRKTGQPTLAPVPTPAETTDGMGALEAATLRDLEKWGKAETVHGVMSLLLARRLDSAQDSGSGVAALCKALMTYWADLCAAADREDVDNPLNKLRRRVRAVEAEPWNPEDL